jgi:thiol-disulfide isomerase/thioredoxin
VIRTTALLLAVLGLLVWRLGKVTPPETPPLDDFVPAPVVSEAREPREGYFAPDFRAVDLDGRAVHLDDLRGRAVFLNFWATWCGPCRREIPAIGRLARRSGSGVAVVTVATDSTAADVRGFLREARSRIPVVVDEGGELGTRYDVAAIPTTFLVDPRGIIVKRIAGARAWDHPEFVAWLGKLAAPAP